MNTQIRTCVEVPIHAEKMCLVSGLLDFLRDKLEADDEYVSLNFSVELSDGKPVLRVTHAESANLDQVVAAMQLIVDRLEPDHPVIVLWAGTADNDVPDVHCGGALAFRACQPHIAIDAKREVQRRASRAGWYTKL
jgi:hypothetical protein